MSDSSPGMPAIVVPINGGTKRSPEVLEDLVEDLAVRLARIDNETEGTRDLLLQTLTQQRQHAAELDVIKSDIRAIKDLLGEILSRLPEDSLKP